MSFINIPFVFSAGAVIIASQHNSNFGTISSVVNGGLDNTNFTGTAGITYANLTLGGNIVNADINSSAAIAGSKIASLDGSKLTGLGNITAGAGVIPSANIPSQGWVPTNIQVFITTGTWTKPAGVSNAYVKVFGAGGNGATSSSGFGGGGGGGGGYAEGVIAVTGNVTVTIGATNSFAGSTTIQATAGSNGATGSSGQGGVGGAGGVGSNGTISLTGSSGANGFFGVTNAAANGGNGGCAFGGGGGGKGGAGINGNSTSECSGSNGFAYGGGGGGAGSYTGSTAPTGGTGDVGAVIVYY